NRAGTSGGSSDSYFNYVSGVVSPDNATDDLAVGGNDSSAPFFVDGATGDTTVGALSSSSISSGNIVSSGDLAVNGGDITSTGSLNITATNNLVLDAGAGSNIVLTGFNCS